jgi:predicted outer membrane protein
VWIQYAEVMVARHKNNAGLEKTRRAVDNIKDPMMKAFLAMELKHILQANEEPKQ